ncbi:MAG: cytochrome b5-like heme/steroid binding domain-containing protein [Patescibacteria group bacterium]|jgi:cytochrome b involved in lipid metabolism
MRKNNKGNRRILAAVFVVLLLLSGCSLGASNITSSVGALSVDQSRSPETGANQLSAVTDPGQLKVDGAQNKKPAINSGNPAQNQSRGSGQPNPSGTGNGDSGLGENAQIPSSGEKTYTLDEVAAHSARTDCWLAINGSVYNATQYIFSHPGGSAAIINYCGQDATGAFNSQRSSHSAEKTGAIMKSLKIGILK